jgi:hypothetical protein
VALGAEVACFLFVWQVSQYILVEENTVRILKTRNTFVRKETPYFSNKIIS